MWQQLIGFLHYSPNMFDRLKSPGMLRHVTQYMDANICEECSAFIFSGYTVHTLNNGKAWECFYLCPHDQGKR